jgi:hypothetical protein
LAINSFYDGQTGQELDAENLDDAVVEAGHWLVAKQAQGRSTLLGDCTHYQDPPERRGATADT